MGCFSYLCKITDEPILSDSFSGDAVHLFLLKNGKVIESMHGNYNSYGCVFEDSTTSGTTSFDWKMEWGSVCDLSFDNDKSNGIAAILWDNWKKGDPFPTERSESDPEQGWGEHRTTAAELDQIIEDSEHIVY